MKKKNFDPLKSKQPKKNSTSYERKDVINSSKSIYTYSKRKPRRLGKTCIYFIQGKLICKLSNQFCRDADTCTVYENDTSKNLKEDKTNPTNNDHTVKKTKEEISNIGITAVVLSDNRKCTNENHKISDIRANLRISMPTGKIINHTVPAAYCSVCDTYFIIKSDFKKAKNLGIILCPIIDRTQKHLNKTKTRVQNGNESRIHQLGYNVIKGNGYTNQQRHTVLANIIENTDISRHEVVSNISKCIAQHKNQLNYSESVSCWKNDLNFVRQYQPGDMPSVIVEKIILGKRK